MRPQKKLKSFNRTVKLVIGFDGTRYEGWQSQKKDTTLQETFEKILAKMLKGKTNIIGSSRTDSGVHAKGFVAHFRTKSVLPDDKIKLALNFFLPRDILVYSAETVPNSFHAQFHAKSKIYEYKIWNSPTRPLFEAPYVLWAPHDLNLDRMKKAAKLFIGKHDFSAFQDQGGDKRNPIRRIYKLDIKKEKELITIQVRGDGFLRHMIRIMAGTLMEVGRGKIKPDQIKQALLSKNRKHAGPTAKSRGLVLVKVAY